MVKQLYHESYLNVKDLWECLKNKTKIYISSQVLSDHDCLRNSCCELYNIPLQIEKIEKQHDTLGTLGIFRISFKKESRLPSCFFLYEDGYYYDQGGYDKKIIYSPFFCIRGEKTWGSNMEKIIEILQNYSFSQLIERKE